MNSTRLFLICLIFAGTPANAHHSSSMFDKMQVMEVTATVVEFQWTNPHIWIEIIVRNEQGDEEAWSIEGIGPNSLFRIGWRPNSFAAGDVIAIRFNPMRDGSRAGGFVGAKFADGHTLGQWNQDETDGAPKHE